MFGDLQVWPWGPGYGVVLNWGYLVCCPCPYIHFRTKSRGSVPQATARHQIRHQTAKLQPCHPNGSRLQLSGTDGEWGMENRTQNTAGVITVPLVRTEPPSTTRGTAHNKIPHLNPDPNTNPNTTSKSSCDHPQLVSIAQTHLLQAPVLPRAGPGDPDSGVNILTIRASSSPGGLYLSILAPDRPYKKRHH